MSEELMADWKAETRRYERDSQTIREAEKLIRNFAGSLRPRASIRPGISDGADDEHFRTPHIPEPEEDVEDKHRMGMHKKLAYPRMDCVLCVQRLAQFRRRTEMRRDVVAELGGHCHLCHEPVTNNAARFARRDGRPSLITQHLQGEMQSVLAEARDHYVLLCPACCEKGGRKKVREQEAGFIGIAIHHRPPRADKGKAKPRRRPGETLAHFRVRAGVN